MAIRLNLLSEVFSQEQYLFDYNENAGKINYQMATTDKVVIDASGITFKYNLYQNKFGSINYNIEGSEGTGMRIFYKVYLGDEEVKCGLQDYKEGYGYLLVPRGTVIKYYHSDKTQCNPATINFNPGILKMNTKYKVVFNVYPSDNNGNILDNNDIGSCMVEFETPGILKEPVATMQIISDKDSLQVVGSMTDINRTIIGDTYEVAVYDLEGNKVATTPDTITNKMATGATKSAFSGTFTGLTPNNTYIVKVTANVDTDNNGVSDGKYEYALTGSTVSTASATVSFDYTVNDELVLSLENVANFDGVTTVQYTIDSSDGSINYTNGSVNLASWSNNGSGTYSYITSYKMTEGQYYYTLQYYDASGKLVGSNTGRFNK